MRTITLKAGPETLTGQLPDALNWDEVRLDAYAAIVAAQEVPPTNITALCQAVALLAGLPAQPLLDDTSLLAVIVDAAPWLFGGSLPPAGEPVPVFTHLGIQYAHVGNLHKISAGQLEALYDFLQANQGGPISCAPNLLAVLYCPAGQTQTAEVVRDTAAAFASLPLAIAWPALQDFIGSSGSAAANILSASALQSKVGALLSTLEAATSGASSTFWRRPLNWLVRIWLRNVRKML